MFAKLEEKHLQTFLQSPLWQQYVREIDGTARQGGRDSEGQLESEESHSDSEHDDASAVHEGRTGHDAAESDAERKARLAREESERRQRFALGRVNEWGVYVRDQTTEQAMVALEPSLNGSNSLLHGCGMPPSCLMSVCCSCRASGVACWAVQDG